MIKFTWLLPVVLSVIMIACGDEKFIPLEGIEPTNETEPVYSSGDAADDCTIWINNSDILQSRVIGTDKQAGIVVYNLNGDLTQYLPDGPINNIDLRYDFELSGIPACIIAGNNSNEKTIVLYKMNESTLELENVTSGPIYTYFADANGLCMYKSPVSGTCYVFVTDNSGRIEQWELFDAGGGLVDALYIRTLAVSSIVEGCVADDNRALLFAAEQDEGIWKFNAEPGSSDKGKLLIRVRSSYYLENDLEGLALFNANGKDYLIASVQGNSTFAVFRSTDDLDWIGSFRIVKNRSLGIDKVTHTDGFEIYDGTINSDYPHGFLAVQDDKNDPDGLNQNFKYVSLQKIIDMFSL